MVALLKAYWFYTVIPTVNFVIGNPDYPHNILGAIWFYGDVLIFSLVAQWPVLIACLIISLISGMGRPTRN